MKRTVCACCADRFSFGKNFESFLLKRPCKMPASPSSSFESALFTNDAVVLGLLTLALGLVFYTHSLKRFNRFYTFVPALLLCYFIPATLNSMGIVDGEQSSLYFVASRYLLPAKLDLVVLVD